MGTRKTGGQDNKLHEVCTVSLQLFCLLTLYLKPVLPKLAAKVEIFLNIAPLQWSDRVRFCLMATLSTPTNT